MLLLDAGNALYSGARQDLNQLSEGRVTIEAMNTMGYDAMALGPYDLSVDLDTLRARLAEARFAVISANARVDGEPLVPSHVIVERAGMRIALIGLTGSMKNPVPSVEVLDPTAAVAEAMGEIGDTADYVVVLSTLGPTAEADLAQPVLGIDLIVGGGSGIPQNEVARQGTTALVRAGGLGEYLGITEVGPDGVTFESIPLGPEIADDPEMTALLQRYMEEYQPASTVVPK